MNKYYLMAPGPSMIPERVLLEMAKPIIHHRTESFEKIIQKVRSQLKTVFQTRQEVFLHASVGTGAMESSIVNCFSEGDKVLAIRSGKFGERWSEIAKKYALNVVDLDVPWGEAVQPQQVRDLLKSHGDFKGVLCQASETSTGVSHPIEELGQMISQYDALFLVDAITAMGVSDIKTDAWGLDVVISGSQKAFMLPPGLSMLCFSEKAWKAQSCARLPRYYFDAQKEKEMLEKNQTHFTPAISLICGLSVALDMIFEETLPKVFGRHQRMASATRAAVGAMGLKLFSKRPSESITAVVSPDGLDGEKIVGHLQSQYGITIIGGQDRLKKQVFRLGHMGYCGDFDIVTMIAGLEMTLRDLGSSTSQWGEGVKAAMGVLHEGHRRS